MASPSAVNEQSQSNAPAPDPQQSPPPIAEAPPPGSAEPPKFAPGFAAKVNVVVDLVLVFAALVVSTLLAGGEVGLGSTGLWILSAVGLLTWAMVGTGLVVYHAGFSDRSALDDTAMLSILILVTTVVVFVVRSLLPVHTSLPALSFFVPLLWPPVVLLRLFVFRRLEARERPLDEVLIVGAGPMGRLTGEDLLKRGRRRLVGYVRFTNEKVSTELKAPMLGTVAELEKVFTTVPVDDVYISGNVLKNGQEMQAVVKLCERFGLPFALPAYPFRLDRARPVATQAVGDGYLHFVTYAPKPHQMAIKRMMDIALSAGALVALTPLFLFVAVAIKVTSRGPIFFKQERTGLHGKPFYMLKFRSMVVNAEELKEKLAAMNEMQGGPTFKMKNDPRITSIGRFIRKYSIDELPQLMNVLRGEMSLVGPRPPVPKEVAQYAAWQRRRLSVRPGLTCIWQVSGRNQISFEEWMYMDMQYIDNWNLKDDIALILRTVPAVLTGDGAS